MEIKVLRTKGFPTVEEYKEFSKEWDETCREISKTAHQEEKILILYPRNDSMIENKSQIDELIKNFTIKCLKTGGREDMKNYIFATLRLEPFIRAELNELVQAYPDASINSIVNVAIHEMYERLGKEKSNKATSN